MAYAQPNHGDQSNWRAFYKRPDGTYTSKSGFPTSDTAKKWGEEQESLIQRHLWTDPRHAEVSFGVMSEEWEEAIMPRLGRGTAAKYRSHLDVHILPQWRDWPIVMIFNGYLEIEKWVTELHEDLAESTVASIFATFSTIMNAIARTRIIPANPCSGVRVTSGDYETEYLVATPTQALRAAMRLYETFGLTGFVLCLMDFYSGGRWGELVGQQPHEYDPERRGIDIRRPLLEVGGELTKGGKSIDELLREPIDRPQPQRVRGKQRGRTKTPAGTRFVELPPSVAVFYELLLKTCPSPFVFATPDGQLLRRSNFRRRQWRPAWDGVDVDYPTSPDHMPPILPWFTFHEGRHTSSTWMIEDGIAEVARRARLGQKLKGISRIYDHVTPQMHQRILDTLEERWQSGLHGLTPAERARLESWFLHLRPESDITGEKMIYASSTHDLGNAEKPSLRESEKGSLTWTDVLVGDTGIEPVTSTVSR